MMLSAIADGGMNSAGNRTRHNDRSEGEQSSRLHDNRTKSAPATSRNGIRNTNDSRQAQEGAVSGEDPLRLDVLEEPRLKQTEGLVVGYEWIDISEPGENGKQYISSSPRCGHVTESSTNRLGPTIVGLHRAII